MLSLIGISALDFVYFGVVWHFKDWLTADVREKLRAYVIAPPEERAGDASGDILRFVETRTACPRCGARDVTLTSAFGSTPCKALYRCNRCREPFDHFKCH